MKGVGRGEDLHPRGDEKHGGKSLGNKTAILSIVREKEKTGKVEKQSKTL